jgi:hypothetical protein
MACCERDLQLSAEQIGQGGTRAAIRHMDHVEASHHFEQFAGEMRSAPVAGRSHVDDAWIGLCIGNELGDCLGWN